MSQDSIKYSGSPIPGVLQISSNVPVVPNFPLIRNLDALDSVSPEPDCPLDLRYIVSREARSAGTIHGKSFEKVNDDAIRLETPIGNFSRLSLLLQWHKTKPCLKVNKAFHRLARVTIGNVHSTGWLVRDLSNITLLSNGYALLHTAALKLGDKVILIFGLSNTGKTKTVFSMVKDHGAQFYGDDLVLTDGEKLYACPYTGANVDPSAGPGFAYRAEQVLRRGIPFFENIAGTFSYSISDALGAENIAPPTAVTDVIIMRKSDARKSELIGAEQASALMLASNRTEFTFASSPLLSAAEFFETGLDTAAAINREASLLQGLAERTNCHSAQGDYQYLGELVREITSLRG